ncbi:MAG TPA: hypothetical protein VEK75_10475 [Xanthobacteraceae bacterium]|nr:hypothetical protein [Xanthobacteraceae bacterium]
MRWQEAKPHLSETADWRGFVFLFLRALIGGVAVIYLFILLVDPYGIVPFSLPLDRRIVSINQRYMYPQIVRSGRFDSLIIGTSTSRLIDPQLLDGFFHARFANLAMDSATAWEQQAMLDLFLRTVGPPKVLIVGLDVVWCDPNADHDRITFRGFPRWLYDGSPWDRYLHLLNAGTLEVAVRLVGYQFGLYRERIRFDGYDAFVPLESQYDAERARRNIWGDAPHSALTAPAAAAPPLSAEERSRLAFPALSWLDAGLARLPDGSLKILAFMPVHVAAQPPPGSRAAAVEAECKARIAAIGRNRGATVIDWRIASDLTRTDTNYWDSLHYRVPVADRLAQELAAAALSKSKSEEGSYVILVR